MSGALRSHDEPEFPRSSSLCRIGTPTERVASAITRPYREWISEDYYVFVLREVAGNPNGLDLVAQHGDEIARILRGENSELARSERAAADL